MNARSDAGSEPVEQRRVHLYAEAGMAGAVLFVSVFSIFGWLSPGYSPTRMFVSELSFGT